jgi:transketolase
MRKQFSNYIEQISEHNENLIFITGDLGYGALENVKSKLGDRFINAGVAEQNMIGMAAGMAHKGFQVICYSIAPFVVYRCLEQIRNDVCFHNLPVFVVGNGGGYGYGIMGSTHHAIEDLAALSGLPNMSCYIPSFSEDLKTSLDEIFISNTPAYLRLGVGKNMPVESVIKNYGIEINKYYNSKLTIIAQGPVANNLLEALKLFDGVVEVDVFTITKMPLITLPQNIKESIVKTKNVLTIEEHISIGGISSMVSFAINTEGIKIEKYKSLYALGYPDNLYGSQSYHQKICGLDFLNISNVIKSFL